MTNLTSNDLETTDDYINYFSQFGNLVIRRMDSGKWYSEIEFPTPNGIKVEVRSDFKHETYTSALIQLLARFEEYFNMNETLKAIEKS